MITPVTNTPVTEPILKVPIWIFPTAYPMASVKKSVSSGCERNASINHVIVTTSFTRFLKMTIILLSVLVNLCCLLRIPNNLLPNVWFKFENQYKLIKI